MVSLHIYLLRKALALTTSTLYIMIQLMIAVTFVLFLLSANVPLLIVIMKSKSSFVDSLLFWDIFANLLLIPIMVAYIEYDAK